MASEYDWQGRVGRLLITLCFVTLSVSAVFAPAMAYSDGEPRLTVIALAALAVYTVGVSAFCLRVMWTD